MPAKKSAAERPAAIHTKDGQAIVGGRPGEGTMYRHTNSWGVPLADDYMRESTPTARIPQPVPEPVDALPYLHVARQVAGREIQRLRATEAAIERELSGGVIGANGSPNPYLMQRAAENRAALETIREDIERLESLSDDKVRQWAADQRR